MKQRDQLAMIVGQVYAGEAMHPGSSVHALEQLAGRLGRELLGLTGDDFVSFREHWMDVQHAERVLHDMEGAAI